MSKVSKTSKMSKQSTIVGGTTSKVGKTPLKKDQTSNADTHSENLYYYNCPVFRVSFDIRYLSIQLSCNGWLNGLKFQFLLFQTTLYFAMMNHFDLNLDDTEAKNWREQQ